MDGITVPEQHAVSNMPEWPAWLGPGRNREGKCSLSHSLMRLFVSGGLSLFRYLRYTGMFRDPGLVILSSHDFARFRAGDLGKASTLITIRRLNLIKHLDMFLNSLVQILPPETHFVGCFSQTGDTGNRAGKWSRLQGFPGRLISGGIKGCHLLDRQKVSEILGRNGLSLISMTEMNGVTYFHSRKAGGHPLMIA